MKFSFDTIENFDNHIDKSVSNYREITDLIKLLSTYFITDSSNVYDLGCSTGRLTKELSEENPEASFIGYDISSNMIQDFHSKNLSFYLRDVNDPEIKFYNTNLILSIFTLQFIELEKRITLLKKVYNSLNRGGAFIVTEKIFLDSGFLQDVFIFTHYDQKQRTFQPKEILDKQRDLRKIMRPLTDKENIDIFKEAGFTKIETFYQSLNFKGWILVK
jgi:tRNA (cmo5U34)-methyltransferase